MRWIEIITLRTGDTDAEALTAEIRATLTRHGSEKGAVNATLLVSATVRGDLSIHLHHVTKDARPPEAQLGTRLARGLEDFGLVSRTLWQEALPEVKGR